MRTTGLTTAIVKGAGVCAIVLSAAACGSSSPSGPSTGAAATAAITKAYETLFDLANPALAPKIAVIQDGAALSSAFSGILKSPLAKLAGGANVISTAPLSASGCQSHNLPAPCDSVKFNIVSTKGKVLLRDSGFAVYAAEGGGTWLVAKVTVCGLLSLAAGGKTPQGC